MDFFNLSLSASMFLTSRIKLVFPFRQHPLFVPFLFRFGFFFAKVKIQRIFTLFGCLSLRSFSTFASVFFSTFVSVFFDFRFGLFQLSLRFFSTFSLISRPQKKLFSRVRPSPFCRKGLRLTPLFYFKKILPRGYKRLPSSFRRRFKINSAVVILVVNIIELR